MGHLIYRQSCDPEEGVESIGIIAILLEKRLQVQAEVITIIGKPVREIVVFGLCPNEFNRIKFWCVRGQKVWFKP